jgi:hypothetical protein
MVNSKMSRFYVIKKLITDVMNYAKLSEASGKVYITNSETNVPRISGAQVPTDNNYNVISSKWVEDGSFLRVKNITLSYNVPASILSKQRIVKGVRATVSGQNLFTFTKYTGYDPEVGASVGANVNAQNQAIGLDYGRYPLTRIYSFSLNVNF